MLLGAAGCEQDDGDSCQVTRDCADGLICVVSAGSVRGSCRSELPEDAGTCDAATNEGSCPPGNDASFGDASLGDASLDAGGDASLDAGGDASQPDGGDASPPNDDDAGG